MFTSYDQTNNVPLTGLGELSLGGHGWTALNVVGGLVLPLVVCQAVDSTDADQQLSPE